MDKLHSYTAIEMLSVNNSMEGVCGNLDDRLTGHAEETDRHIGRITEELKAKTRILEMNLSQHVEENRNDIQSITQELIQVNKQTNTDVPDKISVYISQKVAEKQEYQKYFLKLNQKIDNLKESLSVKLTGDKTINNNINNCPVIILANGNLEGRVSVVSTSNHANAQTSTNASRTCENVCKRGNTVQVK